VHAQATGRITGLLNNNNNKTEKCNRRAQFKAANSVASAIGKTAGSLIQVRNNNCPACRAESML
jgi:hypothetical protein